MRRAWLAVVLGTLVAACGVTAPFHVQQVGPFGLPGLRPAFPFGGLGAIRDPRLLPPFLRPPGLVPQGGSKPPPVTGPASGGGQAPGGSQPPPGQQQPPPGQQQPPPVQQPPPGQQQPPPSFQGGTTGQPVQSAPQPAAQQPVAQQPPAQTQQAAAQPAVQPLLTLVPKGAPTVAAPAGVAAPTGIPNITKGSLKLMPNNTLVLTLADGRTLTAQTQKGKDSVSFSLQPGGGGTVTGILTMLVGEPYTGAYVITDTGGRVFTVRQEYTRS